MVGPKGKQSPAFNCPNPNCGNAIILGHDYKVSQDGLVNPIVVCMYQHCEFNEHVRLDKWSVAV